MKHFTHQQVADIDSLAESCATKGDAIKRAIDAYNEAMASHIEAIKEAKDEYNEELAGLREIMEGLHQDAEEYQGNRSEKWQEGEKGRAYSRWVDSMEGISQLDALDFDTPEPMDHPDDLPDWDDRSFMPADRPDD